MSSEDALNGIFNILETMVNQEEEKKKKSTEEKADKTIIDLLQGIVDQAKTDAGATAGQQLEELSKGLNSMKNIDHESLDKITISIINVNKALNSIKVDDNTVNKIDNLIDVIDRLANINVNTSKNIIKFIEGFKLNNYEDHIKSVTAMSKIIDMLVRLSNTDLKSLNDNVNKLNPKIAERLTKFIDTLINSLQTHKLSSQDVNKLIKPIKDLFVGLSSVVTSNIFKL